MEFGSWIIPFTFIPGVAMLVLSTATRLFHVSSLIREIVRTQNRIHAMDIEKLVKRTYHFHKALVAFYISIGLLAISALIGSVTGFVSEGDALL